MRGRVVARESDGTGAGMSAAWISGESSLVGEAGGDDTDRHGGEDFGLDHVDDMTGVAKGLVSPHIIGAEPAAQCQARIVGEDVIVAFQVFFCYLH